MSRQWCLSIAQNEERNATCATDEVESLKDQEGLEEGIRKLRNREGRAEGGGERELRGRVIEGRERVALNRTHLNDKETNLRRGLGQRSIWKSELRQVI
jgi:hypothetical protein